MLKRRKIKVKERYGSYSSKEDKIRDTFKNAEVSFRKLYKSMSNEEKKKISFDDELYKVNKHAEEVLSTQSVDDMEMTVRGSGDKPKSLNEFTRYMKDNLHPNLCLISNNLIGENVGGHSIMFRNNEDLEFICGVGKSMDKVILPESEVEKIYVPEKDDWERKIKSRGWLTAVQTVESWIRKHGLSPRRNNFK